MHPSIDKMLQDYCDLAEIPKVTLDSWHFCDNEKDANECAQLVLQNIKRATSPSLWWYQANQVSLPQVGDRNVVTNWQGEAQCIIETIQVSIVAFKDITADYAKLEGEGDKTLAYWRRAHWDYYHRELAGTDFTPIETMPIVCEVFKVVYKNE